MLNKASLENRKIRSNQKDRVAFLVKIPMIKVILLKVHLPVGSSRRPQLVWVRLGAGNSFFELLRMDTVFPQTNCINSFKVKSGQSKGILIQNAGTTRLPKVINGYGNRGIVVPAYSSSIYSPLKIGRRGRILDFNLRRISTTAVSTVRIESNSSDKLLKLAEHCKNNTDRPVGLERIYRLMYDPILFEIAYEKLRSKPGKMTRGISPTTLDGMSMEVINEIISKLKENSFKFSPGRRVEIPKGSGGKRSLTIAPPRDKIVQEVMRMILEAIFEPTFSDQSHGFRPNRSCHTALKEVKEKYGVAT